jgi:hypothetical protein
MSLAAANVIAEVLRNDVSSIAASTIVAAYPAYFSSEATVPKHLYMCLKDIWSGSSMSSADWQNMVTASYGTAEGGSQNIVVIPTQVLDSAYAPYPEYKSNEFGAEWAEIYIYLARRGRVDASDSYIIEQACSRLKYLLDVNYRTNIGRLPAINTAVEPSINPNRYFFAHYYGLSNIANAKENAVIFHCSYTLLFLRP